jgi:hypothetical protein
MSPADRAIEAVHEANKKHAALSKLKEKNRAKRAAKLATLDAEIADAEVDALAVLDHFETTGELLTRCDNVKRDPTTRCNLASKHSEPCRWRRFDEDDNPLEPAHVDGRELLRLALTAFKRTHPKSRGDRLWLFRTPTICGRRKTFTRGDVVCRFCNLLLIKGGTFGVDYHTHVCSALSEQSRAEGSGPAGTVAHHTTICALRYLAKVKPTPPPPLPRDSFVLVHDGEENPHEHAQ